MCASAEVVRGFHGDTGAITKALAGADRLFWLVAPPPGFRHARGSERLDRRFIEGYVKAKIITHKKRSVIATDGERPSR